MITKKLRLLKKRLTKHHVIQSLIAGLYAFAVFIILDRVQSELLPASLGASAFIAFTFPHKESSKSKALTGGYIIGAISGLICFALSLLLRNFTLLPGHVIPSALALALSLFIMTVLDFKHPPACAFAVAIAADAGPLLLAAAGIACVIVLCALKELLLPRLRDL